MSKQEEVYFLIQKLAKRGIIAYASEMSDRGIAETIRDRRSDLARAVADAVVEQYSMLELYDIMEWKRTRTRR